MKNKFLNILLLIAIITLQGWFMFISFTYTYTGITVEPNKNHAWVINQLSSQKTASVLGLQLGDIIKKVNNKEPDAYPFIKRWRSPDQFQTLVITRNGKEVEIETPHLSFWADYLFLAFLGEAISLIMALLLYMKFNSDSARLLSFVFLNIGLIFLSLGASIRGDVLGKIIIGTGIMLLPIIFLHFLIVLLREKGGIKLPYRFIKYLYVSITFIFLAQFIYFKAAMAIYLIYHYIMLDRKSVV